MPGRHPRSKNKITTRARKLCPPRQSHPCSAPATSPIRRLDGPTSSFHSLVLFRRQPHRSSGRPQNKISFNFSATKEEEQKSSTPTTHHDEMTRASLITDDSLLRTNQLPIRTNSPSKTLHSQKEARLKKNTTTWHCRSASFHYLRVFHGSKHQQILPHPINPTCARKKNTKK